MFVIFFDFVFPHIFFVASPASLSLSICLLLVAMASRCITPADVSTLIHIVAAYTLPTTMIGAGKSMGLPNGVDTSSYDNRLPDFPIPAPATLNDEYMPSKRTAQPLVVELPSTSPTPTPTPSRSNSKQRAKSDGCASTTRMHASSASSSASGAAIVASDDESAQCSSNDEEHRRPTRADNRRSRHDKHAKPLHSDDITM